MLELVTVIAALPASAHGNTVGIALRDKVGAGSDRAKKTAKKAASTRRSRMRRPNATRPSQRVLRDASLSIGIRILERSPKDKAFLPQPKR